MVGELLARRQRLSLLAPLQLIPFLLFFPAGEVVKGMPAITTYQSAPHGLDVPMDENRLLIWQIVARFSCPTRKEPATSDENVAGRGSADEIPVYASPEGDGQKKSAVVVETKGVKRAMTTGGITSKPKRKTTVASISGILSGKRRRAMTTDGTGVGDEVMNVAVATEEEEKEAEMQTSFNALLDGLEEERRKRKTSSEKGSGLTLRSAAQAVRFLQRAQSGANMERQKGQESQEKRIGEQESRDEAKRMRRFLLNELNPGERVEALALSLSGAGFVAGYEFGALVYLVGHCKVYSYSNPTFVCVKLASEADGEGEIRGWCLCGSPTRRSLYCLPRRLGYAKGELGGRRTDTAIYRCNCAISDRCVQGFRGPGGKGPTHSKQCSTP